MTPPKRNARLPAGESGNATAKESDQSTPNPAGNPDPQHAFTTLNAVRDAVADMTATENHVLWVLASHADGRTGKRAFPSSETLAKEARLDRRSVLRSLASLKHKGLITLGDQSYSKPRPEGGKKPVVYDINLAALKGEKRHEEGEQGVTVTGCKVSNRQEQCDTQSYCNVTHSHKQYDTLSHKQPSEQPLGTTPTACILADGKGMPHRAVRDVRPARGKKKLGDKSAEQQEYEQRGREWEAEDRERFSLALSQAGVLEDDTGLIFTGVAEGMTPDWCYDILNSDIDGIKKIGFPGRYFDSAEYRSEERGDPIGEVFHREMEKRLCREHEDASL